MRVNNGFKVYALLLSITLSKDGSKDELLRSSTLAAAIKVANAKQPLPSAWPWSDTLINQSQSPYQSLAPSVDAHFQSSATNLNQLLLGLEDHNVLTKGGHSHARPWPATAERNNRRSDQMEYVLIE